MVLGDDTNAFYLNNVRLTKAIKFKVKWLVSDKIHQWSKVLFANAAFWSIHTVVCRVLLSNKFAYKLYPNLMAKVLGQAGRYTTDEASRQQRQILIYVIIIIGVIGFFEGILVSSYFPLSGFSLWFRVIFMVGFVAIILVVDKYFEKKLGRIEKKKNKMLRGAAGEILVGNILEEFPEDYCVINGLSTASGDLDHVVIGPTGIYVLDTKAWRGLVTSDGKDELLLNGQSTEKPFIRQFVRRMMGIREKVLTLAPGVDVRFNAVFVFTSARVEAKWGTTGNVNCITNDQLYSYIVETDFGKKLSPAEVTKYAQAFLGLAHMDSDFTDKALKQPNRVDSKVAGHNDCEQK